MKAAHNNHLVILLSGVIQKTQTRSYEQYSISMYSVLVLQSMNNIT